MEALGKSAVKELDVAMANFFGVLITLPLLERLIRPSDEGGEVLIPGGGVRGRLSKGGIPDPFGLGGDLAADPVNEGKADPLNEGSRGIEEGLEGSRLSLRGEGWRPVNGAGDVGGDVELLKEG